jgi:hypothetical protein
VCFVFANYNNCNRIDYCIYALALQEERNENKPAKESQGCRLNYLRTLYVWLKSEDKQLLKAIADSQSVLEVAEDLQREHMSVLRRLNELEIFSFDEHSEEWVEFMGLGLAGVPLKVVIDWCSAAPARLHFDDIEALAMGDLRAEFALAREFHINVVNSDAVGDLSWLLNQPASVQSGYRAAYNTILARFDAVTPATLRAQVLGLTPAQPVRQWIGALPSKVTAKTRKYSGSKPKAYRRKRTRAYTSYKRKSYA